MGVGHHLKRVLRRRCYLKGCCELFRAKVGFRRVVKLMIFMMCTLGFTFQTYTFLQLYWSYPTVVDVSITSPNVIDLPAISVCSFNALQASLFCEKYPKKCTPTESMDSFCTRTFFCDRSKNVTGKNMPVVGPSGLPKLTKGEFKKLGPDESFLIQQYFVMDTDNVMVHSETQWAGVKDSSYLPNSCYVLNSLWENIIDVPQRMLRKSTLLFLAINDDGNNFYTGTPSSFQLAIHNPYSLVNPFTDGFSLRSGSLYYVYVKMVKKQLLPAPYATNCTDYFALWKERGGKGPLSAKLCTEECMKNMTIMRTGCSYGDFVSYDEDEIFCYADTRGTSEIDFAYCADQCPPACYTQDYQIETENHGSVDGGASDPDSTTKHSEIRVAFNRMEEISYRYIPKYESVELFSYVGGYLGMWLGISLMAVCDLLETLYTVINAKISGRRRIAQFRGKGSVIRFRSNVSQAKPDLNRRMRSNRWDV